MCDFISWIETYDDKESVLFLTDDDVYRTRKGCELRKYIENESDIMGHGAIDFFYGTTRGLHKECGDFSSPKNFPKAVVKAIKAGKLKRISQHSDPSHLLGLLSKKAINMIPKQLESIYKKQGGKQRYDGFFEAILPEEWSKDYIAKIKKQICALKRKPKNWYDDGSAGGTGIFACFTWSKTRQGHDYWKKIEGAVKAKEIGKHDAIWELFKNKNNRAKAWR